MTAETLVCTPTATIDGLLFRAAFCVHQARELEHTNPFQRHYLGKAEGIVGAIAAVTGRNESELEVEVGRLAETL